MKLLVKLIFEFTPLFLFFLASTEYTFYGATVVLLLATAASLAVTWLVFRQLAIMAIITAVTGFVAGGITLLSNDPAYVQMKPTIVCILFGLILVTGLLIEKPLFKALLGQNLHMTEEGWRILTMLWIVYFFSVAGLNEYIRHAYEFKIWASFKVWGLAPLTVIYAVPQIFLMRKYRTPDAEPMFGARVRKSKSDADTSVNGAAFRQPSA
jgi:intracellular septation protein